MRRTKLRVIPGGRSRRSKLWLRLFALGMVVLTGFLVWNSLGFLSLLAAKVTVVRHSEVKSGAAVTCVVARAEQGVSAPIAGSYIPLVADGTRVRRGQIFARIEGAETVALTAPIAGLVCHGGDGLNLILDMTLDEETVALVAEVLKKPPKIKAEAKVKKGELAAVIIDNVRRYQLFTNLDFHAQGKKRTLKIQGKGEQELLIPITPREVLKHDSRFWVRWDAPTLPDSLGLQRVFAAEIITGQQQMALIPAGALLTKDGVQGVVILHRNKPVFNPVEVLYAKEGVVGVSGLADGQRVLSLPRWASFAKRWWLK